MDLKKEENWKNLSHIVEKKQWILQKLKVYIYLEQVNSSNNYFNGAQNTLLCCIHIENKEFGDIVSVKFEHPEFKKLTCGTISEFYFKVRDENGQEINNHNIPMSIVLETK